MKLVLVAFLCCFCIFGSNGIQMNTNSSQLHSYIDNIIINAFKRLDALQILIRVSVKETSVVDKAESFSPNPSAAPSAALSAAPSAAPSAYPTGPSPRPTGTDAPFLSYDSY